jgi:hypothetical protein
MDRLIESDTVAPISRIRFDGNGIVRASKASGVSNRLKFPVTRSGKYIIVRNVGLSDSIVPKMVGNPMQEQTHLANPQY